MTFLTIIVWIFNFLKISNFPKIKYNTDENSFAAITGPTSGIGLEFCKNFAKRGYNIILIGRNKDKLLNVKNILNEINHNLKIKIYNIDFHTINKEEKFIKIFQDDQINFLINNVGISYDEPGLFHNQNKILDIINCNITNTLLITKSAIQTYYKNGNVSIINISSILGKIPIPFFNVYSSSKLFISRFTQDLKMEYKFCKNFKFYSLEPWLISTKMSKSRVSIFSPTPEKYVNCLFNFNCYAYHDLLTIISNIPIINILLFKKIIKQINRKIN